tara:strand:- start:7328 stop:8098 length:771 start_codon:yes stop_codon:yes gene_type:complete
MNVHTVFVVPYRNRSEHKAKFLDYYNKLTTIRDEWGKGVRLLIVEQDDDRPFNRGAMKNIGALHVHRLWGRDNGNITLVFHDIDSLPVFPLTIDFSCKRHNVNHIYGNSSALGGIFSIRIQDFFRAHGFPNIWGWGYEDNIMTERTTRIGLSVNRDNKIDIADMSKILRLDINSQNTSRAVSIIDLKRVLNKQADGMFDIADLAIRQEDITLKVQHFSTRYAAPRRLTTIGAHILKGNVMHWVARLGKRRMVQTVG